MKGKKTARKSSVKKRHKRHQERVNYSVVEVFSSQLTTSLGLQGLFGWPIKKCRRPIYLVIVNFFCNLNNDRTLRLNARYTK